MKVRVHVRLSPETAARLREQCLRRRKSYASVVETAVRDHLNDSAEPALLLQRLDRADRRIDRLEEKLDLLVETIAVFVNAWYVHHPKLTPETEKAALVQGNERYNEFTKFVAKRHEQRSRGGSPDQGPGTPSTTANATTDTRANPRSQEKPR